MLGRGKALRGVQTRDRPSAHVTEENKPVLTLLPLQLRKAANGRCLDYFHYNLIPGLKERERKG